MDEQVKAGTWYVDGRNRMVFIEFVRDWETGLVQPVIGYAIEEGGNKIPRAWSRRGEWSAGMFENDLIRPATTAEIAAVTGEAPEAEQEETPPVLDWGKPIQTNEDPPRQAKLMADDMLDKHGFTHAVRMLVKEGVEVVGYYRADGTGPLGYPSLVNVPEEPPEPECVWVNGYATGKTRAFVWNTFDEAERAAFEDRICRIRVPLEHGRFD